MELNKKDLAITILLVLVGASLISNIILPLSPRKKSPTTYHSDYTAVIGYFRNPTSLDPIDTDDKFSRMIQHQIAQSLVEYDISSYVKTGIQNYTLKPVLAEYWVWESSTRLSYRLRENIYFHDNSLMTAEDVKWNFERIQWFINASGNLPENKTSWKASCSSLYFFDDGTPIFSIFEADDAVDPFNFTIVSLWKPRSPIIIKSYFARSISDFAMKSSKVTSNSCNRKDSAAKKSSASPTG